jgi:Spy/CpxP family protein refolding chaperone
MKSRYFVSAMILGVLVCSSVAFAQQGRRGRGGPPGGGFFGGPTMMLMDEQIRAEMEIVPEQHEKIKAVGEKFRNEMRDMWSGFRDLNEEEREAKMAENRAKMQERMSALQEEINKELLPHQVARLGQLHLQSRIRRSGTSGALQNEELVKKLGITEDQKKRLQEVAAELQKDTEEKMRKIREEARKKLLEVLTPAQQKQLEEMIGTQFERPEGDRRFGGGRRPGGDGGT